MAKRLRALNGIDYPDAQSLGIMLRAGGFGKMTHEQRANLKKTMKMTRREAGDSCDDMPEKARARYLASGDVEEVEDFEDFGPTSNAVVHGQEAITPQGGGHQLAREIAAAQPAAASAGGEVASKPKKGAK